MFSIFSYNKDFLRMIKNYNKNWNRLEKKLSTIKNN